MPQQKGLRLLQQHHASLENLLIGQGDVMPRLGDRLVERFNQGNKLLLAGQGMLASVAELIAVMFMHRLNFDRPPLPAIALGTSLPLTQSFERHAAPGDLLVRQFNAVAQPGDLTLLFAEPQQNPALRQLTELARDRDCPLALFCNNPEEWSDLDSDLILTLPADSAAELAAPMLFSGRLLCEMVEKTLFGV